MKKLILLFSFALIAIGCSSDGGTNSGSFSSDVVIDGIEFNPNKGVYGIYPYEDGDLHREMYFSMQRMGSDEVLNITIMIPFSKTDIAGTYDFGPGTADDLLVSGGFSSGQQYYGIIGYSLDIAELGDSRFRFTFNSPEALHVNENFTVKPFEGNAIEGNFTFED